MCAGGRGSLQPRVATTPRRTVARTEAVRGPPSFSSSYVGCARTRAWKRNPCGSASRPSEPSSIRSEGVFDVDGALKRVADIDQLAAASDFWNDQQKAQALLKEQAQK